MFNKHVCVQLVNCSPTFDHVVAFYRPVQLNLNITRYSIRSTVLIVFSFLFFFFNRCKRELNDGLDTIKRLSLELEQKEKHISDLISQLTVSNAETERRQKEVSLCALR